MTRVLSLAVGISIIASGLAWADSLVLPDPVKLSDGELGTVRGGAPSATQRATSDVQQSTSQSAMPSAAPSAAGTTAILNNGVGGAMGSGAIGGNGLGLILNSPMTSGSRSFGQ
jgi:hypothetical protein